MARVRISTTVDRERLERCRRALGVRDSQLLDRALSALVEEIETQRELAALRESPYEQDPDLSWTVGSGPVLPYDGDIPTEVVELAERRRRR